MGRACRPHPKYLAAKLREIRRKLGVTQQTMMEHLVDKKSSLRVSHISEFESGKREPPLHMLLGYSRLAGVPLEILVDDELALPWEPTNFQINHVKQDGVASDVTSN